MNVRWAAILLVAAGIASAAESPVMRDFIGINGHTVMFRPELYRPVARLVRDYHPVEWDLGGDPAKLPDFPFAKNRVNWRSLYGSWTKAGWQIDVSLMFESVPRDKWRDLAGSARAYGRAFAQAFGPSSASPVVRSVEIGNEPGKWSDEDYATMARAMAEGLRAGDPKLQIATCNLTVGKSGDYDKSVACLDGLLDHFDVLTIHSYAQLVGWPTWRRSYPEDPQLPNYLQSVEALCQWRDAHAKAKPVWITEFGYDSTTKPPPATGDFTKWQGVTDPQQAQWLVRSLLVFSAMPVERAYIYFFNDKDDPMLHGSSGLTRDFAPKPSFHAVAHLQRALGDYRFARVVENRAGALRVQEYRAASGRIAWAVWSPTGSGRTAVERLPALPGKFLRAEQMPLEPGAPPKVDGPRSGALTVSESPQYLFFQAGR